MECDKTSYMESSKYPSVSKPKNTYMCMYEWCVMCARVRVCVNIWCMYVCMCVCVYIVCV